MKDNIVIFEDDLARCSIFDMFCFLFPTPESQIQINHHKHNNHASSYAQAQNYVYEQELELKRYFADQQEREVKSETVHNILGGVIYLPYHIWHG